MENMVAMEGRDAMDLLTCKLKSLKRIVIKWIKLKEIHSKESLCVIENNINDILVGNLIGNLS